MIKSIKGFFDRLNENISGFFRDVNLTRRQKKFIVYGAMITGIIGFAISCLFTFDLVLQVSYDMNVLGVKFPAGLIAIGIVAVFQFLEIASFMFAFWMKRIEFLILTLLFAIISITASSGFVETHNKKSQIKMDDLSRKESLIDSKKQSIKYDEKEIDDYRRQIGILQAKYNLTRQEKNDLEWLFKRKREAVERKTTKETEFNKLSNTLSSTQQVYGAITQIKSGFKNFICIILEFSFLILTLIGIVGKNRLDIESGIIPANEQGLFSILSTEISQKIRKKILEIFKKEKQKIIDEGELIYQVESSPIPKSSLNFGSPERFTKKVHVGSREPGSPDIGFKISGSPILRSSPIAQRKSILTIKKLAQKHPNFTQKDINILACDELGRKKLFAKSFISETLAGKKDYLL